MFPQIKHVMVEQSSAMPRACGSIAIVLHMKCHVLL
ncbi:hypothetical protein CsSME_00019339 [Camellia sinensis var. sinensis]